MIKRTIYDKILNSIKNRPVTLITGARQVGKSTLCHQLVRELKFNYVSLDDIYNRNLAIKDTGLACYLAKLNDAEILKRSIFAVSFVATYIINEIMKSYLNNNIKPNFYYYRDNDQKEIDLIILDKGKIYFIECKSGTKFNSSDIKAFNTLEAKTKYEVGGKCIICNTEGIYKIEDTLVLPITAI